MPQLFGSITIHGAPIFQAMFCSDSDQSNIATIHWWRDDQKLGQAATFHLNSENDTFSLKPITFYRSNDNGGLYPPELTIEEKEQISKFRGFLKPDNSGGYIGSWEMGEKSGEIGFFGQHPLFGTRRIEPTICSDWQAFKKWADSLRLRYPECAFRGHGSNAWPLTTTISRAGRTRLERYYNETIHTFRIHAEVAMDRDFDLSNPVEYSTLLGLAQHHGLPSPLLDITESPYVAAYFAFADAVENKREIDGYVRIYAISGEYLKSQTFNSIAIANVQPYIRTLHVPPRHNARLYAQQGRFLVTNIVNLEEFFNILNSNDKEQVLFAADIPNLYAFEALHDLKYMGLTAGSLFPGLDGVSRMIKQMMMVSDTKHQLELIPKNLANLDDQTHNQ